MKTGNYKEIVTHHTYNWMIDSLASFHVFKRSKKPFLAVVSGTWSSSLGMSLLLTLATFIKISRASSLRPFTSNYRTDSGINIRTKFRFAFADIPVKEPRAVNKSTSFPGCLSSALPRKADGREPGNEAVNKWVKNERALEKWLFLFVQWLSRPHGEIKTYVPISLSRSSSSEWNFLVQSHMGKN